MPSDDNWQTVHKFLFEHFQSQEAFTAEEMAAKTTWSGQTAKTYMSKQLRQLLVPLGNDRFRVSEAFRRFATWDRFHVLVSQMRPIVSEYTSLTYENVLIYEFFMPLTNEEHLRASLDALFYKDTILHRLRTVAPASLKQHFPEKPGEAFAKYLDRTTEWLSTKLGGYSISHVSGRFKAARLATFAEAAAVQAGGARYLIDETTAIVRFNISLRNATSARTAAVGSALRRGGERNPGLRGRAGGGEAQPFVRNR